MHRTVFRIICLLAIVPVFSLSSSTELWLLAAFAGLFGIVRALVGRDYCASFMSSIWGASLFVVPWVGSHILLALSLVVCFVAAPRGKKGIPLLWAAPMLAYLGGSVAWESFSALSFLSHVRLDELSRVRDAVHSLFDVQAPTWKIFARACVFALCVEFFETRAELRGRWIGGVRIGAFAGALYAIVQWCGLSPIALENQSQFWSSIHRISGLATDPNALGVALGLALWCFFCMRSDQQRLTKLDCVWVSVVFGAGLVSGSRTFLIAAGLLSISLAFLHARRVFLIGVVGLAAMVCLVTTLDAYTSTLTTLSNTDGIPEGIKRGVLSISLLRIGETFFSRLVFLDVTLEMWRHNLWYGVGADAYRSYVVPVGAKVGTLKHWSDNANNFYLGLLAELGVMGALAFLVSVASRQWSEAPNRPLLILSVLTVAALLVVGPHVEFPEVLLLVALFVGLSTNARLRGVVSHWYLVAILMLAGIIAAGRHERGVYPWRETSGGFERWITPDASIELGCDPVSGTAALGLKPQYVPTREALHVLVQTPGGASRSVDFKGPEAITVPVVCPLGSSTTWARIITSPAWSPARAWPGQSGDRRLLGVKQQSADFPK